jgi:hypothetical protein
MLRTGFETFPKQDYDVLNSVADPNPKGSEIFLAKSEFLFLIRIRIQIRTQ